MTPRYRLELQEQMSGTTIPELHPAPIPPELTHVWEWFLTLNSRRQWSRGIPSRLTFHDIACFAGLFGIVMRPLEMDIIGLLDDVFIKVMVEKPNDETMSAATPDGMKQMFGRMKTAKRPGVL